MWTTFMYIHQDRVKRIKISRSRKRNGERKNYIGKRNSCLSQVTDCALN